MPVNIDLLLIALGTALVALGIWLFSPATMFIVVGAVLLMIAFGRYKQSQSVAIVPNDGAKSK